MLLLHPGRALPVEDVGKLISREFYIKHLSQSSRVRDAGVQPATGKISHRIGGPDLAVRYGAPY